MSTYKIQDTTLTNIADAIRLKNGSQNQYAPGDMPGAIEAIPSGSSIDYNDVNNKPSINSVVLSGNKTDADLGIQSCIYDNITDELYTMVDGTRVILASYVKSSSLIPVMTSYNTPSGIITFGNNYSYGNYGSQNCWYAFDNNLATRICYQQEDVNNGYIAYEFSTNNIPYVTKIVAQFGNYQQSNSITATLFVSDENDNETEIETQIVTGYEDGTYGDFIFIVNANVKKLKFVFGEKTSSTNIFTYNIQAYGYYNQ